MYLKNFAVIRGEAVAICPFARRRIRLITAVCFTVKRRFAASLSGINSD
jgi:hypothetical protein